MWPSAALHIPNKLSAVFLDVGDTLLREDPPRFAIYAEEAARFGVPVDPAAMGELMRAAHHELPVVLDGAFRYSDAWFEAFIERIFCGELGLPEERLEELTQELFRRFEDAATFRLYPGAIELLDRLRVRGCTIGIISNWSARLPRVLEAMDLASRVDFVLCSALEAAEKPEAVLFTRALERAGVPPEEAVHAGDHPVKDVRAARECGLAAVLVDHRDRHADSPDTLRVRSLSELSHLLAPVRA